ncbi:MAG: pyridoxal-dependent decarboxylase [Enterobacterales bacterium]|nr:pyridoxal-dependent decarboxylase [Enterobacterales bacterium]
MYPHNSDWQNMQVYFDAFTEISQQFFDRLDDETVAKLKVDLKPQALSDSGLDFSEVVERLKQQVIPQLSAARGPRYWGFVTGGATPIATFADWLVATFDQNVHKAGDSVASLIELQAIEWLCELFELPKTFQGLMTTGATASNFLAACCARQFAGLKQGINVAQQGVYGLDVDIFSTTPHASMCKSLGMSGLGQKQFHPIKALPDSEAMDVNDLAFCLSQSTAKAKIVIASAGTVTTTDFDDLAAVASICQKFGAWLHVDAAFGLFERVVMGTEGKTKGIEKAHSITLDCHKWLNVPYDCGVFLTQHRDLLEQSFDLPAPYLANESTTPDFMSLGVENSRRFRALPVWLSLLAYGKQSVKDWVESNINLAKQLADWIDDSDDYELVHPCQMNVILFRPTAKGLSQSQMDQKTKALLKKINTDGRLFLSPGIWQGQEIIRIALSNWQTQQQDIEVAIQVLKDCI